MAYQTATANLTPMQQQFSSTYETRRKARFLYVAKEVTGRAIQREAIAANKSFNWKKFTEYFDQYYANYTSDQLLAEILNNVDWLASEQAVIDLYFTYQKDAKKHANNNKQTSDNYYANFVN